MQCLCNIVCSSLSTRSQVDFLLDILLFSNHELFLIKLCELWELCGSFYALLKQINIFSRLSVSAFLSRLSNFKKNQAQGYAIKTYLPLPKIFIRMLDDNLKRKRNFFPFHFSFRCWIHVSLSDKCKYDTLLYLQSFDSFWAFETQIKWEQKWNFPLPYFHVQLNRK